MSSDDARAVASALSGGMDGHRRLYERFHAAVVRLVSAFYELEPEEEQGLVEESFARAFAELPSLLEPARFGVWLLGNARQVCLVRRAVHRGRDPAMPSDDAALLARDPGPEEQKRLLARAAVDAIGDEPTRQVAHLFYGETAATPRQIAAGLGLEVVRVGEAIERVRARVKATLAARLLEQRCDEPPCHGSASPTRCLGPDLWGRVLRGVRFEGEKALAAHLRAGCADCDAFLCAQGWADGLDGETDATLIGIAPVRVRRHDEGFERILRRLKLDSRLSGRTGPARARNAKALPLALAGGLAVAGMIALLVRDAPQPGAASVHATRAPAVGVGFAVAPAHGDDEAVVEGTSGDSYREDLAILVSYELLSPAFVNIVRLLPDGRADLLAQPGRIGPGVHDLTVNDVPARVGLRGAVGRNRFAVVASATPLDMQQLADVVESVAGAAQDEQLHGALPAQTAAVWFDVVVEPADEAPAQRARVP